MKLTAAGLMLPRNGMKQEELCDVAIALGQVYPFIRKSECHRSAMLSVNIVMSKSQMLGKKPAQYFPKVTSSTTVYSADMYTYNL